MLNQAKAYATIPVADLGRAKQWYEEKLGLKPAAEMEGGALYETGGGSRFVLYPTDHAGQAPQTVMTFEVADVVAEVKDLKGRGVVFEEYDSPGMKTVDSIATMGSIKGAWLRDGDGNILGVVQM